MKKANKKIMAVILSVAIVLSSANWNAFAITPKDYTDNASTPASAQVQDVSPSESSAEESSQVAPESLESEQPSEPVLQPEPTEAPVPVAAAAPAVQATDADVASVTFDGRTTNYSTFDAAWKAANNASTSMPKRATVKLLADIAEYPELFYVVAVGKYITLDLNNHTLTGNKKTSVITVSANGNFHLEDNSDTKGGKITGGEAYFGGGVIVDGDGTFMMTGGSITGNTATIRGGGVYVGGKFIMVGGSITGNTANQSSGGVCVDNGMFTMIGGSITANDDGGVCVWFGTFEMIGGSITGNKASYCGGGVYVYGGTFNMSGGSITGGQAYNGGGVYVKASYGTFTMSGGSITGNTASGNGGGVYGSFTMSGNVNITNNTVGKNANNVYLPTDQNINIDGSLDVQSRIGVTMETPGVFTSGLGGNAGAFTSDDASYNVLLGADKEAYLSTAAPKVHVKQGSTISVDMENFQDAWTIANEVSSSESDRATVQLLADIAETPESTYEIASGKHITLDLKGYTLTGNGTTSVITVNGDFQLEDNSAAKGGKITGGQASYGGGVFVDGNGTFEMSGGSITGNTTANGGGVYVESGTFTMFGGSITGNTAANGGGVCVYDSGTFEMSGGSITGNTARHGNGGGVYVWDGTFTVSGNVNITSNTVGESANNVYLSTDKKINIDGSLDVQSRIGVTLQTPGVFTGELGGNADTFTSDDASYNVFPDATTKEAYLSTDAPKAHIQHSTISGNTKTFQDAWTIANEVSLSESDRATVKLLADIAESPASTYEIASDKHITLDLNGHTLTGNGSTYVIKVNVNGDFQLEDNSTPKDGKITGGKALMAGGGGVYVAGGTFTMSGGIITGNTSVQHGGGVHIWGGSFTMTGGSIKGNTANYSGGGVSLTAGTFAMTGGSITGNTASGSGLDGNGGGVYAEYGTFEMTGGSITGNTANQYGGGVYVLNGTFTMSGNVNITSNTKNGKANNVYLSTDKKIKIVDLLDVQSPIGITMETPGVFTSGLSERGSVSSFTSDDENYSIGEIEGEAALSHVATINVQKDGVFGTKEEPVPGGGGESGEPSGEPSGEGETFTSAQAGTDATNATPATGDVSAAGMGAVIIIAGAAVVLAGKRRKEGK